MALETIPLPDRPREKLRRYGPGRLNNSELIALLLGTGTKDLHVLELAKKILRQFPNVSLTTASYKSLDQTFGLGPKKAALLVATFELGRRLLKEKPSEMLFTGREIWSALKDIRQNRKEHVVVFYLDGRNQVLLREIVSVGTVNGSMVHPREIFEPAVKHLASQLIIAHNHPSGLLEPSSDDLFMTERLIEAGKIMGIEVLDHIIVTEKSHLSIKDWLAAKP